EECLALAVAAAADSIAATTPALIARSYDQAWRPEIIERAASEDARVVAARAWARRLGAAIDSSLATVVPDSLARLEARAARLGQVASALRREQLERAEHLARVAVERELMRLGAEREGI